MIKARPEDFTVDEQADLPLRPDGPFRVYLLTKSGWATTDLMRRLARFLGVSPADLSYGGKKDKHGRTRQHITIRDGRDFSRAGLGWELKAVGRMDRPMGPDLLRGNAFRIVIRDLADEGPVRDALEAIDRFGVPNFFDDQRFRSHDPERGFFAERVVRRQWNGALQTYLTSTAPGMTSAEKARRAALFARWKDWPACRELARGREETEIFDFLVEHPRDQVRALHKIPPEEVSMRFSAFQSHLWNELLRRTVREAVPDAEAVPGADGPYLFWRRLDGAASARLGTLLLPTAAAKMVFPDDAARDAMAGLLRELGLKFGDFRTEALRRVYFKSSPRAAAVRPEGLAVFEAGRDELYPGRRKIGLAFSLPRGSYATMVVKRATLGL